MKALVDALRAERNGKLEEALAIVEAMPASAVRAAVASRLALAVRGPEAALELARFDTEAWSARAALALATAAAELRVHTAPALERAHAALASVRLPDSAPDAIDPETAAAVAGAGEAARFLTRASLASHALECAALAAARAGDARAALDGFEQAYAAGEGDPDRRARVLLAWGLQLRNWGLLDEALRRIERSLELRVELEDLHGAAICHGVLAFVHQRRGDFARERDALAADLRICEQIGSSADIPSVRARLAGALVGLGKYAAAWSEAALAIEGADPRARAFARREQARVRLAEGDASAADVLLDQAIADFHALGDAYAAALCELTRAQLELARSDRDAAGAACDRAAPVFARLGAIAEAAELALARAECDGDATRILAHVIPALVEAGFGATPLAARARELAARLSPDAVRADLVERAARLPALASKVLGSDPGGVAARAEPERSSRGQRPPGSGDDR